MSARVHFYGFNDRVGSYVNYHSMIETFAADAMGIGWEYDDYDREYIAEQEKYSLLEMYDADENCIEVLFHDGSPIGVLDESGVTLADLAKYAEQMAMAS